VLTKSTYLWKWHVHNANPNIYIYIYIYIFKGEFNCFVENNNMLRFFEKEIKYFKSLNKYILKKVGKINVIL